MNETPVGVPATLVEITVDGETVAIPEGVTILDACRRAGLATPPLCWAENLTPVNVCRVCVVEVEGSRVLDLFCGVGAFGLEALSRGARRAHFVDNSSGSLAILGRNIELLGFDAFSSVERGDAYGELGSILTAAGYNEVAEAAWCGDSLTRQAAVFQDPQGVGEVPGQLIDRIFLQRPGVLHRRGAGRFEGAAGREVEDPGVGDHLRMDVPVGQHELSHQREAVLQLF